MGSFCEIVEVKDEQSTSRRPLRANDKDQKPPIMRKGFNKFLEDDINKLFESVNIRTSKSFDLSETRRNPSKKPMRGTGGNSPVIGFSEAVSLKQALRGMCISQAAEMAAVKRSSMPASPRISEAGKISNIYKSVVVESGELNRSRIEMSLVPQESTSSTSISSNFGVKPITHNIKSTSSEAGRPLAECIADEEIEPVSEVDIQTGLQEVNDSVDSVLPRDNGYGKCSKPDEKICGLNEVESVPSKDFSTSLKVVGKAAPKPRQKSRLQNVSSSSLVKGKKDVKSTRIRPVIRNKTLIIRKLKKVNSKASYEVNSAKDQLICQRCQCSLMDTSKDSIMGPTIGSDVFSGNKDCDAKKLDSIPTCWDNRGTSVVKTKGDISQSSKSSDFSSSTTSLSEDSNLSGSTCGSKPHMSKDVRWQAIDRVRKQYGFLGLSHFNLLKKLGSGDIGTVYLAELEGTNCPFAIKVMDNEFLSKRKKMVRAQTEREILRMLDHPFLPTLYAQFTSDNLSCLVMEFCPGGDLHVLRQKQPGRYFPEQAARFYVAEVLLALEYLHMLGIIYRDLKPENILVREDGHIMLTDFDLSLRCSVNPTLVKSSSLVIEPHRVSGPCVGSSCIDPFCTGPSCKVSCFSPRLLSASARARKLKADALAQARSLPQLVAEPTEARSNSFVGTHEYLAPEIIKGEGHGSAVDWWTFGVFLYELLYGRTPFRGAGNEETLNNVVLQNLRFPDGPIVSFQARDLIRGLLVKDPENRLGTETGAAEIKRHPFFEGLNWALIRCAAPPQIPDMYDVGNYQMGSEEKGKRFLECGVNGEHLEFELF
ncbi:hypothetical protein BUALT_Bualt11G0100100 [Buddleja alternifolia]|uniref:non-specific serine/threonine protein kinase n=1 Tax=Buddleja alternifolia TaxID=168488 RepID=A0AAV6X0A2_9LAMI|nr:hypothetical protein BUALT_Bualt11G0100100 [Buddleja alternifolia]